jgi:hypothetical protein
MNAVRKERIEWELALVRRASRGDVRAFERLYRENVGTVYGTVYGLCLRLIRHRANAEDCTQEAFMERRVRALHELPQALEPPRDLWPQVEAQLHAALPERSARPSGPHALPAWRWAAAAARCCAKPNRMSSIWLSRCGTQAIGPRKPAADRGGLDHE